MSVGFSDRLAESVRAKGSVVVLGLDPRWDRLPEPLRTRALENHGVRPAAVASALEAFCLELLDAAGPCVCAAKVQVACFEAWGAEGYAAYPRVVRAARERGLPVIADAKRGDVGHTAELYAAAHLGRVALGGEQDYEPVGADAMTVSPYLGTDAMDPFLRLVREQGKGLFVLARTSNPGSADFQELPAPRRALYLEVAGRIARWGAGTEGSCGLSSVGAVAGATHPEAAARLREVLPAAWLLVPGVGAQGGRVEDLKPLFRPDGLGVLVNAGRSVIEAKDAASAARALRDEVNACRTSP